MAFKSKLSEAQPSSPSETEMVNIDDGPAPMKFALRSRVLIKKEGLLTLTPAGPTVMIGPTVQCKRSSNEWKRM